MSASGGGPPGGGQGGGPYGSPPGGGNYGGPPGGGGFGGAPPPGGGGFGQPPGGGFGGPPGGYGNPPPYMPQVPGQSISGNVPIEPLAIGSLIVGLISVPGSFCCSFAILPVSLAAIVTGIMAFGKARQRNDQLGKLFAISGIGTGAVGIVLLIVFLALGMAGAVLGRLG
jgi:hypothetical protein